MLHHSMASESKEGGGTPGHNATGMSLEEAKRYVAALPEGGTANYIGTIKKSGMQQLADNVKAKVFLQHCGVTATDGEVIGVLLRHNTSAKYVRYVCVAEHRWLLGAQAPLRAQ